MQEPYPGTQAVVRALSLLKAFSDARPAWHLTELAQAVGLNKTTAYRLLSTLERAQFLVRDPATGAYRLGPELIALGASALRSNDLRSISRPSLEALAAETGETTSLEILVNDQVLILDEVSTRYRLGVSQDVGSRLPAHATSTGKVLLAHQPAAMVEALLQQPLARLTERTLVDPTMLRQELEQVRRQGYAVAAGELEAGFVAVAAPIFDHHRQVVAAVSVGGPSTRLNEAHWPALVEQVQRCARHISHQLGYRPAGDAPTETQGTAPASPR
ncbi:IclR family transcriptional regulator [Litorilinea aerophila]|uniref:Glycerol operon regulatory protein n=1 Tax=Litorilinea aerophila TaxID=1204385 RepID=A0A540VHJ0_9CHLR|nr:IclR family transcriptional regulator [Litorilinea aerophila]MCC9076293.1 IclR family transcriptional regulator [Litorilinea aerophila]GIV80035.1 MAG: IclR family transcriptional regulator [Litorilinea sp.]